jgi:hypothetical protein
MSTLHDAVSITERYQLKKMIKNSCKIKDFANYIGEDRAVMSQKLTGHVKLSNQTALYYRVMLPKFLKAKSEELEVVSEG